MMILDFIFKFVNRSTRIYVDACRDYFVKH